MSFSTTESLSGITTYTEPGGNALDGEGGGAMPLWFEDRKVILDKTYSSITNLTDKSEYGIPAGVLASGGIDRAGLDNESRLGIHVEGEASDNKGDLTGSVRSQNKDTGEVYFNKTVTGVFRVAIPPGPGVTSGEFIEQPQVPSSISVAFKPSFSGVSYTSNDVSKYHYISYSSVKGKVTDVEGGPVESVPVVGSGDSAVTNKDGEYEMLSPVETEVSLTSLQKTLAKSVTVPKDSSATVDWQFPGMKFRVLTPMYEPISGAPVEIDGREYTTDENGEVIFKTAGLGKKYNVRVFDSDEFEDTVISPDEEGRLSVTVVGTEDSSFSGGSGGSDPDGPYTVSIRALDISSGRPVKDIGAVVNGKGIRTSTGPTGYAKLVIPSSDTGTETITVGGESKRYRKDSIDVDLVGGDSVSEVIRLQKETETVNF